jgi:hypothetical protein
VSGREDVNGEAGRRLEILESGHVTKHVVNSVASGSRLGGLEEGVTILVCTVEKSAWTL